MSKIDLTSQSWCDLIFEGKNKEFGAYELRNGGAKRHRLSLIAIAVLAILLFTVPTLIKMVLPKQDKMTVTEVTTLSKLPPAEDKKQEQPKVETPPPPPLKSTIKFTAPVIKKDEEVSETEEIKTQEDLTKTKAAISIADIKGTDEVNGKDIAELKDILEESQDEEKPYQFVEQMPAYPGGASARNKYLSDHLTYPEEVRDAGVQGTVVVQFTVSRAGDVTNIKVLKGLDPLCDKEAVRVISRMPKWIPGKHNGRAVPVLFVLPIAFQISN